MSEVDYSTFLNGVAPVSVEEIARQQGVTPAASLDELRADLWDGDDLDRFLAEVHSNRQRDIA